MKGVAGLIAAAAVAAGTAGTQATASTAGGCGPAAGQTLARSAHARVYSLHGAAYACAIPDGPSYTLGILSNCLSGGLAGPFAAAGGDVAYGLETCGVDFGTAKVIVRNARTGATVKTDPAADHSFVEGHQQVGSLALKADGSDAWIGVATSIVMSSRATEVHRHDRTGATVLDSGNAIDGSSLRLKRSRLTWKHGARTRHATLR